jgi:hypothetical protein
MRFISGFLVCGLLSFGTISAAMAEEVAQGPNKEKCESVEKKVPRKINDKPHICDFKCVFLKCDTVGKELKNCAKVTHYGGCEAVAEAPKKSDPPKKSEAPKTETPKKTEAPKTDAKK